jgi:SAM-dependent methyltransferase
MEAQFDRYGDEYEQFVEQSIGWSGVDHAFFVEAKARHLLRLVRRYVGDPTRTRALDVGCGIGLAHRYLSGIGELHGVDASEVSIARAREENPEVAYTVADAASLPYDDGAFDVSVAVGLLHHVSPASRDAVVRELVRVARALTVVFEHNPLNPLTRVAVDRCAFDEDAVLLGPSEVCRRLRRVGAQPLDQRYILFFPRRGSVVRRVEDVLRRVPFGAQYYVAARR